MRLYRRPIFVLLGITLTISFGLLTQWILARPFAYEAGLRPSEAEGPASVNELDIPPLLDASPLPPSPMTIAPERPLVLEDAAVPIVTAHRETPSFQAMETYLLVGMDRTRARVWGRSDTVILLVFEPESGHVGVVSVPRDLYVDVPGHGPARLNAVMRIATRTRQDPLRLMMRVVSDTLGMPIQHVLVGNLEVLERTVDALGGVGVDIPCPIQDNFIDPRTPNGRRRLDVVAGAQTLDGVTAAMYIRSRHGRSDWSRARRQQAVLLGLRDRVRELSVMEWLPVFQTALNEGVHSSMSRLELLALIRRLRRVERDHLHGLLIGHREVSLHRTEEGRAVLLPNSEAIHRALRRLFSAPAPGIPPAGRRCPPADVGIR